MKTKKGISAINEKIRGGRWTKPDSMRKEPRPIGGKELETMSKKCAWTALKIIEAKSGISRAELQKHINDASQAAALAFLEKTFGKAQTIDSDARREMCRAAAKAINKEIFTGRKNSGDYDSELAKREKLAAGNVDALEKIFSDERRAAILANIHPRRAAAAAAIIRARLAGYEHTEIASALDIPIATYYRIIKELKRAALATMEK